MKLKINGSDLTLEDVYRVSRAGVQVELDPQATKRMQASRAYITNKVSAGETIYGVNTGFGALSSVRIHSADITELQKNLIRSHCVGIGAPFDEEQTRAIMLLRANALARGHSGVRFEVVEKILEYLNNDILPVVPQQGSVGASGDLAPLAHIALALMGEGEVYFNNKRRPTTEVLKTTRMQPLELQAKEGLSLINGCQVMTAVGLLAAHASRRLIWLADLAGAMSLEALRGTRDAFDPAIFATRPHPGEAKTGRNLLKLLGPTSTIAESHADCGKVQDAYSLRCMPAVHGAAKDVLGAALKTLTIEANSSTDNPLVFAEDGKILSCGNFHGEPVAFQLDFLGIAMTALSSISECRIEKLINPAMSELPAFLAPKGGLNSGMMIVQVAAASLVSENKILSHPASVDSIPTSADKEDHVSMGTIAARKLDKIVHNAENIIAMEILCACQALDLLKPLQASSAVLECYNLVRTEVPFAETDRVFALDIQKIKNMIRDERLLRTLESTCGQLEWA